MFKNFMRIYVTKLANSLLDFARQLYIRVSVVKLRSRVCHKSENETNPCTYNVHKGL